MPIFWKCWSVTASAGVRPVAGRSRGSSGIAVPDAVDFMTPGPTVEQVAEKANRNIRKLASLAAGKDKAYRKRLIEKYTVGPS